MSIRTSWFISPIAFSINSIFFSMAFKSFVVSLIKTSQTHILLFPSSFLCDSHEGSFVNLHSTCSFIHCCQYTIYLFLFLYLPFPHLLLRSWTCASSSTTFWISADWFRSPFLCSWSILCLPLLSMYHAVWQMFKISISFRLFCKIPSLYKAGHIIEKYLLFELNYRTWHILLLLAVQMTNLNWWEF